MERDIYQTEMCFCYISPSKSRACKKLNFKFSIGQHNPGARRKGGVLASVPHQSSSVSVGGGKIYSSQQQWRAQPRVDGPVCCSESAIWKYILARALSGTNGLLPRWDTEEEEMGAYGVLQGASR